MCLLTVRKPTQNQESSWEVPALCHHSGLGMEVSVATDSSPGPTKTGQMHVHLHMQAWLTNGDAMTAVLRPASCDVLSAPWPWPSLTHEVRVPRLTYGLEARQARLPIVETKVTCDWQVQVPLEQVGWRRRHLPDVRDPCSMVVFVREASVLPVLLEHVLARWWPRTSSRRPHLQVRAPTGAIGSLKRLRRKDAALLGSEAVRRAKMTRPRREVQQTGPIANA